MVYQNISFKFIIWCIIQDNYINFDCIHLAAVAGLAHHPLQQVLSGEITTKSLVTGVGLGLVGVVTKPLSGAAELVALTGQGLLQGAGWNSLPSVNYFTKD